MASLYLTFAALSPVFPSSASLENLVGAISLYAPKVLMVCGGATVAVTVEVAEGAMITIKMNVCIEPRAHY